jgi:hypothetical protein
MKNIHVLQENIYITSNEEIKDGDWFLTDDKRVEKCAPDWRAREWHKKIILTTDPELIKDGVQAIDDDFLEWFVDNPICEFVEIVDDTLTVKEMSKLPLGTRNHKYKIIIPKEELKQETLEEATKKYANKNGDIPTTELEDAIFKQGFIDGAKWQQERSYSEEDVKNAFLDGWQLRDGDLPFPKAKKEWFKQFKNK